MKPKTRTWLEIANNDLEFARDILKSKNRPYYVAHFCHQAIEKMLKAVISELTEQNPLHTHNFRILCKQARLELPQDMNRILLIIAPHYFATKYPEDIAKLYKVYNLKYASELLDKTERLFEWLQNHYLK